MAIFDKFQQYATSDFSGMRGIGLGLSICKSIVELHGGNIKVESVENEGTSISFSLPK